MNALELMTIPDSGKHDTPFGELHFWKWLDNNKGQLHHIDTMRDYLTSIGFVKGKHRINEDDVKLLRVVIDHYGWVKYNDKIHGKDNG